MVLLNNENTQITLILLCVNNMNQQLLIRGLILRLEDECFNYKHTSLGYNNITPDILISVTVETKASCAYTDTFLNMVKRFNLNWEMVFNRACYFKWNWKKLIYIGKYLIFLLRKKIYFEDSQWYWFSVKNTIALNKLCIPVRIFVFFCYLYCV